MLHFSFPLYPDNIRKSICPQLFRIDFCNILHFSILKSQCNNAFSQSSLQRKKRPLPQLMWETAAFPYSLFCYMLRYSPATQDLSSKPQDLKDRLEECKCTQRQNNNFYAAGSVWEFFFVSTHSRYFHGVWHVENSSTVTCLMSVEDTDFSPPATAVMFLLTIHPTTLEEGDFLSTCVKLFSPKKQVTEYWKYKERYNRQ